MALRCSNNRMELLDRSSTWFLSNDNTFTHLGENEVRSQEEGNLHLEIRENREREREFGRAGREREGTVTVERSAEEESA